MNLQTKQTGFTIVELLIVIVVIAILAAISIVAYTGIQDRARNSSAIELANQVRGKAQAYEALTGSKPTGIDVTTPTAKTFTPAVANTGESALGNANVAAGTAAPADTDTAFWNGTKVIFNGSANSIIYRTGANTSTSLTF